MKDFVELGLPEAPHLIAFDGQVISLYNRQRRHEWDEYLDFDMAWEAVISDVPLAEIRAESVQFTSKKP